MYHISDIKKYERCPLLYWNHRNDPIDTKPFVHYNENLMELVKKRLRIKHAFEGHVGDDGALALEALHSYDVLCEARFVYEDLRIKIPVMMKTDAGWNLYFTYASCYPKEYEAQGIKDHITILNQLGICVKEVKVIHLNAAYVRQDALDVDALLMINDYLYNAHNHAQHTIQSLLERYQRDLFAVYEKMKALIVPPEAIRCKNCTRGIKCVYYERCFGTVADDSILHLTSSAWKHQMLSEGHNTLKDVNIEQLEGTRLQYAQVMAAKQNGLFYDQLALSKWLKNQIHYPISYLDFEWETNVFPPYHDMKPYDVLCFQYSLHVEESYMQPLTHYEYIGTGDCRIEFIERLLHDIPKEGSILVFNMEGAEKLRLKQLAAVFPQYATQLLALCNRMVDLSLPFSSGNFYHLSMAGLYSLKKLVTVFSDFEYTELPISYGLDAVRSWRTLDTLDEMEKEEVKKQLFAYCAMDTYAMVLVYHALLDLLENGMLRKDFPCPK